MIVYVSDGDGAIGRESGQLWGRCASAECIDGRSFVSSGGTYVWISRISRRSHVDPSLTSYRLTLDPLASNE